MKRTPFFAFGFVLVLAWSAAAQRTVTNADLERYRQNRERAETQMRENYARMGFPSPNEVRRRNDESNRQMIELAARIRADRLEQERLEAQYRAQLAASRPTIVVVDTGGNSYDPGYVVQYGFGFGRDRFRFRGPLTTTTNGYFAGGQFWPTGTQTRARPIVRRR
jgi:hypothetical protein